MSENKFMLFSNVEYCHLFYIAVIQLFDVFGIEVLSVFKIELLTGAE